MDALHITKLTALFGLCVLGLLATIIFVGNNTGTKMERCARFWLTEDAKFECREDIYRDAMDDADKELERLK